ncbi:hypothetical protein [Rubripirellula reticaptiva]|uniref:Transmembrane protein n=1 Tax=Rubripirellula reticaptiva TaxID=2528013 RepID=A0A5C6ES52_9BACT|nr:hypothetical protein [Rubripirellula reticaptiva]TWU51184.1 hypothetical protein Poly59_27750 [Rubripirellula reticaptiva]
MQYFIFWVVFVVAVVLAVPIVSFLEKRKHAVPKSASDELIEDDEMAASEGDDVADSDEFGEVAMEDASVEDVKFDAPGGNDFSAFEDDFK